MNIDRFKFRIWIDSIQEMSYSDDWKTLHEFFADHYPLKNKDDLMQCTGLKDVKGKLIFDGDILRWTSYEGIEIGEIKGIYVVT